MRDQSGRASATESAAAYECVSARVPQLASTTVCECHAVCKWRRNNAQQRPQGQRDPGPTTAMTGVTSLMASTPVFRVGCQQKRDVTAALVTRQR